MVVGTKVYVHSAHIGCKPNAVLTSNIIRYIKENDLSPTLNISEADMVILSTCAFTEERETACVNFFKELRENIKPSAKLISVGCLNKINELTYIDGGVGNVNLVKTEDDLDNLMPVTHKLKDMKGKYVDADALSEMNIEIYSSSPFQSKFVKTIIFGIEKMRGTSTAIGGLLRLASQSNKVFIEIATGCIGACSYCVIKKAKGHTKSRNKHDVLEDVDKLHRPGKTIYLVGDDCASYGVDNHSSLYELLEYINDHIPGSCFNIGYMNPFMLSRQETDYLDMMKKVKIATLNITMQSGSQRITKAMNRNYSVDRVSKIIKKLRKSSPETIFLTHIMVGFPGEKFSDFLRSLNLMRIFDVAMILPYSERKGTKSADMPDKVPAHVIKSRALIGLIVSYALIILRTINDIIIGRNNDKG